MSYNGWSNRATWNVSLWLNNDEGLYHELARMTRQATDVDDLADKIETFCRAEWEGQKTPDGDSLDDADFNEIAHSEWDDNRTGDNPATGEPIKPIDAFIAKHKVTFTCERVSARPDKAMADLSRHFHCRIQCGQKSFSLYFSQGSAHTAPPSLADALDCLASDASTFENASTFEEWASEFGYDTDSRKAEKAFRSIKRQAMQLRRVLGEEAYNELLWDTERE